jgi:hypothetical protein
LRPIPDGHWVAVAEACAQVPNGTPVHAGASAPAAYVHSCRSTPSTPPDRDHGVRLAPRWSVIGGRFALNVWVGPPFFFEESRVLNLINRLVDEVLPQTVEHVA